MKVQIIKATTVGEQMLAEHEFDAGEDVAAAWDRHVGPILTKIDARTYEMNMRYANALKLSAMFPKAYRGTFQQAIDCLYGQTPEAVKHVVVPEGHAPEEDEIGEPKGSA